MHQTCKPPSFMYIPCLSIYSLIEYLDIFMQTLAFNTISSRTCPAVTAVSDSSLKNQISFKPENFIFGLIYIAAYEFIFYCSWLMYSTAYLM